MLPLCKFYRYLIYRLYHFRNDTPIFNTIATLTIVHWFQLLNIFYVVDEFTSYKIWNSIFSPSKFNPIIVILFGILNFILLYNKKKWKSYDEEFKNESPKERKRGLIIVLSYLIGTIILSFVLVIAIGEYKASLK
jgi:hypothetical protein